jgi:hypothetical protein
VEREESQSNGGFPEPLGGAAVRLVRAEHDGCGAATRVRLPQVLDAAAVRRVVCDGCHEPFDADQVLDVGVVHPPRGNHSRPRRLGFHEHAWRYVSAPLAAAMVVGALVLIQHLG